MLNWYEWNFNKSYVIGYAIYLSLAYTHYGYFTLQYTIRDDLRAQENIKNYVLVAECLGRLIGSVIDAFIVKYSKRYRFIIANFIILFFIYPLYLGEEYMVLILFSGLMYGIGIGLVTTIAPFYMKEVIPESILPLTLVSLQFFLIFGDEVALLFCYIIFKYKYTTDDLLSIIVFLIPAIIAGIQVILGFTVFKRDTPLHLQNGTLTYECQMELQRLYPDDNVRAKEFTKIENKLHKIKQDYPGFKELFSKENRKSTSKGFILVGLQNCVGVFICLAFTLSLSNDSHTFKKGNLILTAMKFMSTFFLFAIIHPKGMKLLLLIGSIGVAITNYGNFILRLMYNDNDNLDPNTITISNMGAGYVFDGISTCMLPLIYACQIMSERGFALSMCLYWLTNSLIFIPFFLLIERSNESSYIIYMSYLAFFCLSATFLVVYVFIKIPMKENLSNEDTSENTTLLN